MTSQKQIQDRLLEILGEREESLRIDARTVRVVSEFPDRGKYRWPAVAVFRPVVDGTEEQSWDRRAVSLSVPFGIACELGAGPAAEAEAQERLWLLARKVQAALRAEAEDDETLGLADLHFHYSLAAWDESEPVATQTRKEMLLTLALQVTIQETAA